MSSLNWMRHELTAAVSRGVRQCVVIGSQLLPDALRDSAAADLQLFSIEELASENLASQLEQSDFDKLKATTFLWLGGASCRTADALIGTLAFIASLPKGSAVLLDYIEERTSLGTLTQSALDALASRLQTAGGTVLYLIQPQAVNALLRGVGFREITDLSMEESFPTGRLVTALV